MTWVKLEDTVTLHPKLLRLSDGAFRLWINGLAFANRGVTNGRIDKVLVPSLNHHGRWTAKQLAGFVAELAGGLWLDEADHYQIHDYEHHQYEATKERVERKREVDREKQRRKRQRDDENRRVSLGMSPGDKEGDTTSEFSVPTRPDPISPSERETRAPEEPPRQPTPKHMGRFLDSLDPDRPSTEQLRLVASMFSAHRKAAGAGGWAWDGKAYGTTYEALCRVAGMLADEPDPDAAYAAAMRGFLADERSKAANYPFTFFAQDFGAYVAKGESAPGKNSELAAAEADLARAAEAKSRAHGADVETQIRLGEAHRAAQDRVFALRRRGAA